MRLHLDKDLADKLKTADGQTLDEIIRLAELELADSAKTALFRDQRSLAMGAAAGSMAVAGLAAVATGLSLEDPLWPLVCGGGLFALLMLASSAVCFWCARPRDYYVPGFRPAKWVPDLQSGQSLHQSKAEIAAIYDAAIRANECDAGGQADGLRLAALFASLALLLGAGIALAVFLLR